MLNNAVRFAKKYYPYLYELRDIRVAGLVVFGIIVLLISWSGVKSIDTNYQLQKQISELKQEDAVSSLGNQNLQLQNEYYKSNQYLDLSARQNLGLALPGETELIVPKSVALRYTVDVPSIKAVADRAAAKQPTYQRNMQAWADFFLHRQDSGN